jgi:hypothetical protein
MQLKDDGRTVVVAMSDPLNLDVIDHLLSLTGAKKIEAQLAGASAIRSAISRWYRGEELLGDGDEQSMRVVNNSGQSVVTQDPGKAQAAGPAPEPAASAPPRKRAAASNGSLHHSAVDVLLGVEETQRRSVAALKAMVELLIEKGVFSRDEYLARVKR